LTWPAARPKEAPLSQTLTVNKRPRHPWRPVGLSALDSQSLKRRYSNG